MTEAAQAATGTASEGVVSAQNKGSSTDGSAVGGKEEKNPFAGTKHKVKAHGGKEIEVDYDEMRRGYGHMQYANERLREAAEKEKAAESRIKQVESLENAFKSAEQGDFSDLVRKVGYAKAKEFAEMLLMADIEWEELSPAEKRARQLEIENKRYKDAEAKVKASEDAKKKEADTAKAYEDIDKEVGDALKELGKKPTPRVVARVIEYMLADLESDETKGRPVSAKDAYKRVVGDMHSEIGEYLSGLSVDELSKVLPEPVREALRNADVEAVLAQDPLRSGNRASRQSSESAPARNQKPKTMDEWFQQKEKRFGGRR